VLKYLPRTVLVILAVIAMASCGAPQAAPSSGKPAAPAPAAPAASAAGGGGPAVASAAPTAAAAAPAPARIRIVYTAVSGSIWPLWIAQDAGLLAKHGIEADLEYVASSTTAMQAMLSGEVALIPSISAPTVVQAVLAGSDAVIVGATNNTVIFYLMATPEIREVGDLRGKRLGITRLGASTDAAARFALNKWGLRPDEDVAIIQMGGVPEILAGMQAGAVQAGVLSSPTNLHARQAGYHELADLGTIGLDYPQTAIGTTRSFLRGNEDVVRRYLRATVEAVHLMKTDPERSKAIFGKWTETTDPAMLEGAYRAYVDKTESVPYIKPAAMQLAVAEVAQTDPRAASAKLEDFMDNRYVEELESSGFVRQVLGR
jgi:ABC-type nitrate/sulfonate/bicarbonate transport system substrate-binding protein